MYGRGAVYESDNVYKTLSLYSHQSKEVLAKTVFVLNVNWLDQDEQDSQKLAQIKKTIEEIERIKRLSSIKNCCFSRALCSRDLDG